MEQTIEGVQNQEDSLERLPENIRKFLRSNKELLEQREADILELLAGSTSPDDRRAAEEALLETESWQQKIEEGRITGIPPKAMLEDKNIMVAVKITDPKVRQLFNTAASQVTRSFDGFQQFGQNPLEGLTAWELKNGNNQQFPTLHRLEFDTYKEMLAIALDTHPQ